MYETVRSQLPPERINRNIVECKAFRILPLIGKIAVLIETLWNVKVEASTILQRVLAVLIETLWNVKVYNDDGRIVGQKY